MANFNCFLTELSAHDMSIFEYPDDNLSKYQWIFSKLGMCIDIVEIWFGIANGYNNLSKSQRNFTKVDMCIDVVQICFGIAIGYSSSIFELSPHDTIMAGYYRFTVLFLY